MAKVSSDYIQAMKSKDSLKSSTLSFLRAQFKNVMIDKKTDDLEDTEAIAIIKKQVKQRQDSITQFEQGHRQDLADKEKQELAILKEYLPQELTVEELEPLVHAAVQEAGATSMKDMGAVMKALTLKVAGRADNKMVSELVRKVLGAL